MGRAASYAALPYFVVLIYAHVNYFPMDYKLKATNLYINIYNIFYYNFIFFHGQSPYLETKI